MPRNGSGGFSLPSGNPVVTGTTISSVDFNNTMTDLATAMSGSVAADGQTPWAGNQNANNNRLTALAAASALTDAVSASDAQTGRLTYLTGVAGTNSVTASAPLLTSYTAGQTFRFIAAATNTTAMQLNVNGIGGASITKFGATALSPGDIQANAMVTVVYDGTRFQLQGVCWTVSTGATGYEISPSGRIEQWGSATTVAGLVTITFPTPFLAAVRSVLVTLQTNAVSAIMVGGAATGLTQAILSASNTAGAGVAVTIAWRATGF